jgi:hypothetical protein
MIYTSSYSCWSVVSDDVMLEAVTFVVIAIFIGQYCRWIGFWSASQHVKASRCTRVTPANWPAVENFYYSSHSCRIPAVSYSNTLWYTDLNDVSTVCRRCVLHLLWWHKLWVWTRRDFQLIFTSYLTYKTKKAKKSLGPQRVKKDIIKSNEQKHMYLIVQEKIGHKTHPPRPKEAHGSNQRHAQQARKICTN